MSAVLLAIFNEYNVAERVRVDLVRDGFPTDRVELTAACEPGRAGLGPATHPRVTSVLSSRAILTCSLVPESFTRNGQAIGARAQTTAIPVGWRCGKGLLTLDAVLSRQFSQAVPNAVRS
jgi:hypothetical protein